MNLLKMSKEEKVEFDDIVEQDDFTDQTPIDFSTFDKTIYDLKHMYCDGKIILQPDFQRQYVWNEKAATLFIDSLIRGVPIPNIFCAETEDGKWEVIDGQQRLTTALSFILQQELKNKGEFTKLTSINTNFARLSTAKEFNESIRGKTFEKLKQSQQKKIEDTIIRVVLLKNLKNNSNLKYDIFMRLNTGANKLNDMELRKCIYRSDFFSKLEELSKNEKFQYLIGLYNAKKSTKIKRMADVNIVLQFAGMKGDISAYGGSYKRWLNKLLETEQTKCKKNDFSGVEQLEKDFNNAVNGLYIVFGEEPIRRFVRKETLLEESGGKISKSSFEEHNDDICILKKLNIALINALMVGFSKYKQIEIQRKADIIKQAIIDIQLNDEDFIKAISSTQTADKRKVNVRINKVKALLENILENPDDKRFFPTELKHKFFEESRKKHDGEAYCAICHGVIHKESDASVDHIKPYSKGGETTEENAQLVHTWCNSSKGNKE